MTPSQTSTLRPPCESVQAVFSGGQVGEATSPAEALANRYAGDPALLRMYLRNLPRRGWAGSMDALERTYAKWVRRRRQW